MVELWLVQFPEVCFNACNVNRMCNS